MRYLVKAASKEGIDQMDKTTGNTALHAVCELMNDFIIVEMLVNAGAELNGVRNDNKLPLNIINEKILENPDSNVLFDIEELLIRKGAKTDWR